jgi:hypothetical protein
VAAKTPEPPVEAAPAAPTKRKPAREPAAPRPSKPDASAQPLPAANHTPPVAETAPPPPPTIDQTYQERTARECSPGFTGTFCRESVKISLCSKRWSPDPPAGQRICAQTVRAPGD